MIAAAGLVVAALVVMLLLAARASGGSDATPEGFGPLPSGAASELPGGHTEWDDTIRAALLAAGFEPAAIDRYAILVKAIIQQESGWNPGARGDYDPNRCAQPYRTYPDTAGYCSLGFGQIHRYWHTDLASGYDLLEGTRNIRAMAVLLVRLRGAVGDDVERLAAAWNGGTSAGLAYPNVTAQVERYVANVHGAWARWAGEVGLA